MELAGFSIIVPTLNRTGRLNDCLDALARLDYPQQQFEVIVVNDGGDDNLDSIVGPLAGALCLRIVNQPNTGPAGARNTGAAQARGRFLAFTDDDCRPERAWLRVLARRLEEDPSRMYGGHTVNALANNVYSGASQLLIDYLYGYYNADPGEAHFFASNNMAMARETFVAVGGFDTAFSVASGEDRDFCDRWLKRGFAMSYVPEAKVLHSHELNLSSFLKQHFNYGKGAWRFRERKRLRDGRRPGFEPLGFYMELADHARRNGVQPAATYSLLLLLSQLANASGFAWARIFEAPRAARRAGRAVT